MAVELIKERKTVAMTGNQAIAEAMRQINYDVVAAYPISPQTELMGFFAEYLANGLVDTEFVTVESEHSAMSAVIGAAASGARAMTATAAQGLLYMYENLPIASNWRLPITMVLVNRALSAPLNIHCDHGDAMTARDSGWIQLFSENSQEAYHNLIMAVKIAEKALLPTIVNMEGYIVSHTIGNVNLLTDKEVQEFIGESDWRKNVPHPLLDTDNPVTYGATALPDYYTELKYQQHEATFEAKKYVKEVLAEFNELAGTNYDIIEPYKLEDADFAIVVMGSTAGVARTAADILREQGIKAGVLKIRLFRPFPVEEIVDALKHLKAVAVLDRHDSMNALASPLFQDLAASMYHLPEKPLLHDFIYGLGGREVTVEDMLKAFNRVINLYTGKETRNRFVEYLQVRE
ncbi:MAG: pyruvate ferredoxin oxidoreductase [Aquificae bacterium]|nr:pyruvate ferredoxin oxidoreductase [Aquificota bacterium]